MKLFEYNKMSQRVYYTFPLLLLILCLFPFNVKGSSNSRDVVSLFSGVGGLDLGFEQAGFNIVWANDFDKDVWETFEKNHPKTILNRKSICDVTEQEIPQCIGIIGGPPCQSWSEAGAKRGIEDERGLLFFEYIRVLKAKRPLFFLAENVSGILSKRHVEAFNAIKKELSDAGYQVSVTLVNAADYGVPQDRERVIFVGYRNDLNKTFKMPEALLNNKKTLSDAIGDLKDIKPGARKGGKKVMPPQMFVPNHEYLIGGFSTMFMSRNRVRAWNEPAFTVQASGRHSQLHPQAPKMVKGEDGNFVFSVGAEHLYRRLTVREAARVQTFPDSFIFYYQDIADGYKMVGNAVPVELARVIAEQIRNDLGL